MKRRNFFKAIGQTAAIIVLAPQLCFRAKAEVVNVQLIPSQEYVVFKYNPSEESFSSGFYTQIAGPKLAWEDIGRCEFDDEMRLLYIYLRPRI